MVKITKTMQSKHKDSQSPWLKDYVQQTATVPLLLLRQQLQKFPSRWPFTRGDVYHWIPVLNRFDSILEDFCTTYGLKDGPQVRDFGTEMLQREESSDKLQELGFGAEGDRELVESVLMFSRMLLNHCGNRSIYASSAHLDHILNTTSLSLIECTLLLGARLAQRYQASIKRMSSTARNYASASVLANHYSIDLDHVLQLALPFSRTAATSEIALTPATTLTPGAKGKDKAHFNVPIANRSSTVTVHANDLAAIVKTPTNNSPSAGKAPEENWNAWGDVRLSYYAKQPASDASAAPVPSFAPNAPPATPTPVRRTSNLGHGSGSRSGRSSEESPNNIRSPPPATDDSQNSNLKVVELTSAQVTSTPTHQLLKDTLPMVPAESKYELLSKIRVAKALTTSLETRRQILAVRLLAITNLSFIHPETVFQEKVLKQDADEPRRLQLVYQLAEMAHPPAEGQVGVPRSLQTVALVALEAFAHHTQKSQDVCSALNITVNHGILLYVVRKAVAEMAADDACGQMTEADEWRAALFDLLTQVNSIPRVGQDLVTAGIVGILVEVLNLRTDVAERTQPKVLTFLDSLMYSARDGFQTLVDADGLDAIQNLIVYETISGFKAAKDGKGIAAELCSSNIDYTLPFYKQQTLKWLFKFIHHMMSAAGGYGGNFDRLLRNLIDSSQLLASLRQIITDASIFGSAVWTNAVSILNDFINNEPTSFAVIAEAGLSKGLLEAVSGQEVPTPVPEPIEDEGHPGSVCYSQLARDQCTRWDVDWEDSSESVAVFLNKSRPGELASGIMPTSETINIIPQAFGAICLNNAGMKMFLASDALSHFFEIFENPKHVLAMETDLELTANLGGTFDELVRHHPPLKTAIIHAVLDMVARVVHVCKSKSARDDVGAKLWTRDEQGNSIIADGALLGSGKGVENPDVEMADAATIFSGQQPPNPDRPGGSIAPFISAVATFLSTIFSNATVRGAFADKGGIEYVIDLAELQSVTHDFADTRASRTLNSVISLLAEQKPHLVYPSLLKRSLRVLEVLKPFTSNTDGSAYFGSFIDSSKTGNGEKAHGTSMVKALISVQSLTNVLFQCFQPPTYNHRGPSNNINQLNLGDYYIRLVKTLGPLLGASVREEIILQKLVPDSWKSATRVKDAGFGNGVADDILGIQAIDPLAEETPERTEGANSDEAAPTPTTGEGAKEKSAEKKAVAQKDRDSPEFKNFEVLRHLFSKMPRAISPFFQILGKALVSKRSIEPYQKQSSLAIAENISATMLGQLNFDNFSCDEDRFSYWVICLESINDILVDDSRHSERSAQCIAIVLQAFKEQGGFDSINRILDVLTKEIRDSDYVATEPPALDRPLKLILAETGTKMILDTYQILSTGKNVVEANQTMTIMARTERDKEKTDYFHSHQFIVEIRMNIVRIIRRLWESDFIDKASSTICNRLIDIIRTISEADNETSAHRRQDKIPKLSTPGIKPFKISQETYTSLIRRWPAGLVKEALFRCNNNVSYTTEYIRFNYVQHRDGRRPDPLDVLEEEGQHGPGPVETPSSSSAPDPMAVDSQVGGAVVSTDPPAQRTANSGWERATPVEVGEITGFNELLDSIANGLEANHGSASGMMSRDRSDSPRMPSSTDSRTPMVTISGRQPAIFVEDLDEERTAIREKLTERSLDVINAHGNVTFEIADLITAVVHKSNDPKAMRKEIGQTLVQALMSFSTEEDVRPSGKKVAAYAHLLALMLQNKDFYKETLDELKENLPILLSFVRLAPGHTSDESSPWIAHVLLIIETLLSEDAQPQVCEWTGPKDDSAAISEPVFKTNEQTVSDEDKIQLLELILEILPRIGKHQDLALAVLRILVILSRTRSIAQSIGEKKNIQRLFVMTKQLAGASTAKLQGPLMLILRHIIEDDETIKQIMRSEIKAHFEIPRSQRHIDVQTYLRTMSALIVRSPKLFLQVSSEMIKLNKWVPAAADSPGRQHLVLKEPYARTSGRKSPEDSVAPTVQATEDLSIQDIKPSTESGVPAEEKPKSHSEHKIPVVESPDGVIHFLLCELLNYRDVEDKESALASTATPAKESPSSRDATTAEATPAGATPAPEVKDTKKPAKLDPIKAEEHPIYIYRCFLLQCLTELLSCYNRTKIEFINFKRSAPPQSMTPSKPRTSVVNYLLLDLIPTGTLEHADSTALRKKQSTSGFADSLITALLSKTGEQIMDRHREPSDGEDEPDLLFVRRFVLENIFKAYKEASASTEPLDVKYSRMMSLAELMSHIMSGKEGYAGGTDPAVTQRSQYQLKRVMFEKGFIGALTSSIADIDLNFPGAKRAVKYILKPLKSLTQTVIDLSESSTVVLGVDHGEEDEISVASSMSDLDEEREETPDLFRNSTLGMFEPGRDDDSSSGSEDDDEEMYEGEYDEEEMEYDEEPDEEDIISDEDEDIEGMGPIEGLSGDHGVDVEVLMEDEDSDEDGSSGLDEDEDSDDMDEDIEVEVIDEHDHEHDHEEDDEDMWESDDEEEDYEGEAADEEEEEQHAMDHMGGNDRLGPLVRALAGDDHETAVEMLQRMEDGDIEPGDDEIDFDGYLDDGMEEIDEEEDDEDDEEESMLDGMYAQDYPMGDPVPPSMFGWDDHMEPPMMITRGGHRPRGLPSGFPVFVGRPDGRHDPLNAPEYNRGLYRSHRPGSTPRGADDGTNPLLQRTGTNNLARDSQPAAIGHWITRIGAANGMLDPRFGGSLAPFGEGPAALLNEIFNSHLPGSLARHGHLHFQVAGGARPGDMARDLQAMFGNRGSRYAARLDQPAAESRSQYFSPQSTNTRWADEAKILFGPSHAEKSARILNELMYILIPAAREAEKVAQAASEERLRKLEEDAKKAAAEARKAEEELATKEKKEKEEREAREAEERRLAAEVAIASGENPEAAASSATDAMEGVEATEEDTTEADAAADRPRITTTIRGQPYDITDLGIDAEFLAELPEEIREEVIMSAVAERRSQAAATGAQPSDIDQDFLDALPEDIRDEIIQQERQDRRRREREEARRNQTAVNAGGGMPSLGIIPADMDAASILATLSPALRQQVLLEQDDEMINLLPPELARQARELAREHGREVPEGIGGAFQRARRLRGDIPEPVAGEGARRRTIVQMLDKPGVATLLRLMFVTQQGSLRSTLCAVLQNVAENRHNRAEVISTLLSVLQDGSADMSAVERSFAALCLRAKQPKESKTPLSLKRSNTGLNSTVQGTSEISPLMVVQQCLYALNYLSQVNQHVPSFFLTEHESTTTLKRSLNLKGKNKASKSSKYAINSLLTLLDRNLIMESSAVMESLSDLLSRITQPLQTWERRQKETAEAEAKKAAKKEAEAAAATETAEAEAAPATEGSSAPATEAAKDKPEFDNKDKETSRRLRLFAPPSIPEHNLKLVINIFVARECSSKTFRETISTIKNLSAIPGAKEVFGRELIHKAQSLGEVILVDLQELFPQIQKATSGTEIQGVALAKFSPGGSDQNKLLRVLTALDHLFDPKANKKDDKKDEAEASRVEKQDLLASLYENSTFGPMWEKLSACLSAIRQREHMLNVATILLPLIESLMVVCKNTTLKDQPISRSQAGKDMALTSPPPDSRMESLFFIFTEEHRKILNDLVRHTPKLMSGTFSLLVKNPKVLEFDNKRNYFTRSIHNRTQTRQSFAPLQIQVRRDQVFLDSFKSLYFKSGDEMKFGKLSIRFHGEEGVDAGGVTREWFQVLSRQMFDPGYALFIPVSSDRTTFHPNISSGINPEHLMFFKFIGRIIGKALYEGRVLDCHFSRAVYKRILGKSVSVKDMESLDPDYYKSLIWMLENDITDIITESFSVDNDKFGAVETIDLIPDGRNKPVTEENKHEYVRLMVEFKLTGSVQEQLDEFLKGFHEIIPAELVAIFNEQELELLISGLPEIDVDDWKSNTEYHNYSGSSPQIQWFWRAVRSFDKEERAKLLQFVTGTSKVPLNGFKELEGMNGFSRFNIHRDYGSKDRLPSSHTCFNQLDLPEYESYEALRQQVLTAITAGSEYFGFA